MKFDKWYKQYKKELTSLKRSFERESKSKINLNDFAMYMFKETKHYKRWKNEN